MRSIGNEGVERPKRVGAKYRSVRQNAAQGFETRRAQASEALLPRIYGVAIVPVRRLNNDENRGGSKGIVEESITITITSTTKISVLFFA